MTTVMERPALTTLHRPDARRLAEASDGFRDPVLVTGLFDHLPDRGVISLDRMAELAGGQQVRVEYYPDRSGSNSWEHRSMTIADYVDLQRGPDALNYFLAEQPLRTMVPSLGEAITVPELIRDIGVTDIASESVFCGVGTTSVLHYHDRDQALLTQLGGSKRVVLLPPESTRDMQPPVWWKSRSNYSTIDVPADPEEARIALERAAGMPSITLDLHETEALFLPVHWWHWVHGLGESVSYTLFWRSSPTIWRKPQPALRAAAGVAAQASRAHIRQFSIDHGMTDLAVNVASRLKVVSDPDALKSRLENG